jgi:hypothetical protein
MRAFRTVMASVCWLCIPISPTWSQAPLSFYPYAQGNVWQYRDASTQEIVYRRYNDSVSIGPDSNIYIRARYLSPDPVIRLERIDTSFNLFLMTFQPDYPRYKFAADSGDSWVAGIRLPEDTTRVTVTNIYQDYVFGVFTTIKVFTFVIHRPPPWQPFWLGDEHLAVGFGLVFALIEGGSAPYLSGATINGVHWGEPIVGVKEGSTTPDELLLHQNYPNPFNPSTQIRFQLPEGNNVMLTVFDVLGRKVAELINGYLEPGYHSVTWDATSFASGVYFARLTVSDDLGAVRFTKMSKLLLMK